MIYKLRVNHAAEHVQPAAPTVKMVTAIAVQADAVVAEAAAQAVPAQVALRMPSCRFRFYLAYSRPLGRLFSYRKIPQFLF